MPVCRWALACALGLLPVSAAFARQPAPEPPTPLTDQTRRMGGPRPAEQMALTFEHLDLAIKVFPDQERIEGDATLTLRPTAPVRTLILDLYPGFTIDGIHLDGRRLPASSYANPEGQLRIALPRPAVAGREIRARIVWSGKPPVAKRPPWEGGTTWTRTPDGQPWIDTSHWGGGCDLLWPCIDHPTRKPAMADLHYTVPAPLVAPGNGAFMGMTESDGWRTYNWRARSPHTYGIVLNVGPYKLLQEEYRSRYGNTIPMYYWYLPGEETQAAELFREFPLALDFFESQIGPYPWADEKMGVIRVPYSGLENQTLNGYSIDYPRTMHGFDPLMHHEFSHEYFANQLAAANYDDLWLHEGFGSYMQPLLGEYLNGAIDYYSLLKSQRAGIRNRQPLVAGSERGEREVYAEPTGPQGDLYPKGSWVMHTLRGLVGREAFYEIIRRIVYGRPDPQPGNFEPQLATTADFIRITNDVAGRDLGWFFDVYLYRAALPKVESERRDGRLHLRWVTPDDLPFPMPLDVMVDGRLTRLPMTAGEGSVPVQPRSTVTIDPQSKLLRQSDAIDRFHAWREANPQEEGRRR
jgi:aminopeptidase N